MKTPVRPLVAAFVALAAFPACGQDQAPVPSASAEPTHAAAPPPAETPKAAPPPAETAAAGAAASGAASAEPGATKAPSAAASGAPADGEPAPTKSKGPFPESKDPALKDPTKAKDQAPAEFKAVFETTAGDFTVACKREWAPHGVDRFYNLVKIGFFDDVAFFRVVKGFVVQFGIHGNPDVSKLWKDANLPVDKVKESNKRGMLTYAMAGSPTTRSTQMFINLGENDKLDKMGFAPLCKVEGDGMAVVEKLEASYSEMPSREQGEIQSEGNAFLRKRYPKLDFVKSAHLEGKKGKKAEKGEHAKEK